MGFVLATLGLSACAQALPPPGLPSAGDVITLQGRLVLKGNSPMIVPVLVTNSNIQWQLRGLSRQDSDSLQSQSVTVVGKVRQPPRRGTTLPQLDVQTVTPIPAGK
jgi:hypothetical protein